MRVLAPIAIVSVAVSALGESARGQLAPDRMYYGVGRPVPVTLSRLGPDGPAPDQVRLIRADGAEIDRAPAAPGEIDLAAMFTGFWTMEAGTVVFAQAFRGGEPAGPALVLQPMVTPAYAPRADRDGAPVFAAPSARARVFTGYRAYVEKHIVFETSAGAITIALRPDAAPNTAWAVRELAEGGFYTDILVHRIASLGGRAEPDIIQFGDPSVSSPGAGTHASAGAGGEIEGENRRGSPGGTHGDVSKRARAGVAGGFGGAGFMIDLEPSTLRHEFGVVSMARGSDPNSASSQVVIALNRERCAGLDGRYAAFGEVVAGADALAAIAGAPVDADFRPIDPPVIRSARLVDAPPRPERPARVADPGTRPVER